MNYKTTIAEIPEENSFPLRFERISKRKFLVKYGCQEFEFEDVDQAAQKFSNCLLHKAQCEGKLDGVNELFSLTG